MTPDRDAAESVLERAARILRAFTADDDTLTAKQLAQRAGLPRSTAHRMAVDLVALKLLDRMPDGAFTIGTGLWEFGEIAPVSMRLR
jgi:DNA-binding IclR family transcriptional regulator